MKTSRRQTSREKAPTRQRPLVARIMLLTLVWWTARLPVAVPDFHEVDHHHEADQACLYHQHLNRWHGEAQNPNPELAAVHEPIFHVHWLMPGWTPSENESSRNDADPASPEDSEPFLFLTAAPANDDTDLFAGFINPKDINQIRSFPANSASTNLLKLISLSNHSFSILNGQLLPENPQLYRHSVLRQELFGYRSEMSVENQPLRC